MVYCRVSILVPTVEKRLLKALEISELFVVETPCIEISAIVELMGLRLAASLRSCQVFLGFLTELAKLFRSREPLPA